MAGKETGMMKEVGRGSKETKEFGYYNLSKGMVGGR